MTSTGTTANPIAHPVQAAAEVMAKMGVSELGPQKTSLFNQPSKVLRKLGPRLQVSKKVYTGVIRSADTIKANEKMTRYTSLVISGFLGPLGTRLIYAIDAKACAQRRRHSGRF